MDKLKKQLLQAAGISPALMAEFDARDVVITRAKPLSVFDVKFCPSNHVERWCVVEVKRKRTVAVYSGIDSSVRAWGQAKRLARKLFSCRS